MACRTCEADRRPDRLLDRHTTDPALCCNGRRVCVAPLHRKLPDRLIDGLLHRLCGAVHPAWAIELQPTPVDAERHPGHRTADELGQGFERGHQPYPFPWRRQRAGNDAEHALRRGHGVGVAPDQFQTDLLLLEEHGQVRRRIGRLEPRHQHHRPLRQEILRQHERLEPCLHPEGAAIEAEREAAESARRVRRGPFPGRLADGVSRQIVLEPDPLIEPLHIAGLECAFRKLETAVHRIGGDLRHELHRRSLRCLDAAGVIGHRQRRVDPHVVGKPNPPREPHDLRAVQQRDRMRLRPRAATLEPIGRGVFEAVDRGDKRVGGGPPHRVAVRLASRIEDHKIDVFDAAADDAALDFDRLSLQGLDVSGGTQLQPCGRGNVGRRMQEPIERNGEPFAEREPERCDHRRGTGREGRIAGEGLPPHDPRRTEARELRLRLRKQPLDHVGLERPPGMTATGQVDDGQ